jgi:hypothetical protein
VEISKEAWDSIPCFHRQAEAHSSQGQGRLLGRHRAGALRARLPSAAAAAPGRARAEGLGGPPPSQAQGRGGPVRAHALVLLERDLRGDALDAGRGQGLGVAAQARRQHRPLHRAQPRRAHRGRQGGVRRRLRGAVLTWRSRRSWRASISGSWPRRTPS